MNAIIRIFKAKLSLLHGKVHLVRHSQAQELFYDVAVINGTYQWALQGRSFLHVIAPVGYHLLPFVIQPIVGFNISKQVGIGRFHMQKHQFTLKILPVQVSYNFV